MVRHAVIMLIAALMPMAARAADTMTGALNERVRSLQVTDTRTGLPIEIPVVLLGAPDGVSVEFDVLHDDRDYLRYTIVHCDASWRPTAI